MRHVPAYSPVRTGAGREARTARHSPAIVHSEPPISAPMGRIPTATVLLLLLAGLTGCASGATDLDGDRKVVWPLQFTGASRTLDLRFVDAVTIYRDTVNAVIEEVWSRLPESYVELDIPIGGANPDAWLMGNPGFRVHGRLGGTPMTDYLECGRTLTGDVAEQYELRLAVMTQLHRIDGRTLFVSAVAATARPQSTSGNLRQCASTGRLERRIATRIRENLVEPRPAGSGS